VKAGNALVLLEYRAELLVDGRCASPFAFESHDLSEFGVVQHWHFRFASPTPQHFHLRAFAPDPV
jgi:hypothetical protein